MGLLRRNAVFVESKDKPETKTQFPSKARNATSSIIRAQTGRSWLGLGSSMFKKNLWSPKLPRVRRQSRNGLRTRLGSASPGAGSWEAAKFETLEPVPGFQIFPNNIILAASRSRFRIPINQTLSYFSNPTDRKHTMKETHTHFIDSN